MSDYPPPPPGPYGSENPPPPPPPPPSSYPPPPPPPPAYATPAYGAATTDGFGSIGQEAAGWPVRAAAWLIDFVLLAVVGFVLSVILPRQLESLVSLLVGLGYYGYMNGELGQTLGKQVMKIKVVHAETGANIGLGMAMLRYVIWVVLFIACVIPGIVNALFPLFDSKKQALHDKAVKSLVVVA